MKPRSSTPLLLFALIILLFVASKPYQNTFDKISVREFELIDNNNKRRASIKVEESGEVVFRLFDSKETIRVKLGAEDDGSGLVLLNDKTDPGMHVLAKNKGTSLTMLDKDGKKRQY